MTRYTVVWDVEVESRFINAWIAGDASMRSMLTAIANWVDKHLAEDPDKKGQPRDGLSTRILAVPVPGSPARVSVVYQLVPDDRQVRVVRLIFRA